MEGAIRAVELGTVAFAYTDPDSGEEVLPELDLVRMAIPRRVYTQSHMDYVIGVMEEIANNAQTLKGYQITYQAPLMRHFTAEFEPIK